MVYWIELVAAFGYDADRNRRSGDESRDFSYAPVFSRVISGLAL